MSSPGEGSGWIAGRRRMRGGGRVGGLEGWDGWVVLCVGGEGLLMVGWGRRRRMCGGEGGDLEEIWDLYCFLLVYISFFFIFVVE
jgi:hypothetical protein